MKLVRDILIFFVRLYQQLLSPLKMAVFGPSGACRFTPSCSQYAVEALQVHGVFKGGALSAWRLCRCHPWGGCGDDPVPSKKLKVPSETETCGCNGTQAASAVSGGGN